MQASSWEGATLNWTSSPTVCDWLIGRTVPGYAEMSEELLRSAPTAIGESASSI